MIFDVSDKEFKKILGDKHLFLPLTWDGKDFSKTLQELFDQYIGDLKNVTGSTPSHYGIQVDLDKIREVVYLLVKTTNEYLNGFPADAYITFEKVMQILDRKRLKVYQKSVIEDPNHPGTDPLRLFRVTKVDKRLVYPRKRVFHTPYNLRSLVSTNRYSIAGYPSLYLSTSLELCCNETHADLDKNLYITSAFKFERAYQYSETNIRVIELGIKPQDFLREESRLFDTADSNKITKRSVSWDILEQIDVRTAYLLWYPLIAACSYIRVNKGDPFAAEYIIPQLLLQWVRKRFDIEYQEIYRNLIGIRYFSCVSKEDSEKGFNYVFPTSGEPVSSAYPYCPVLTKAFQLTNPVYISNYPSVAKCEEDLRSALDSDYDHPNL